MSESFRLDQPRANDLVGNPLLIAGSGGGFEATIAVRVLDGNGQVLVETSVTNTNLTSAWQTSVSLPEPPPTNRGVVQVGPSTGADEAPPRVSYRVLRHRHSAGVPQLLPVHRPNRGHALRHRRVGGAAIFGNGFEPIFEANRHIIGDDPDLIHPGTVLRLPSDFSPAAVSSASEF